MKPLVSAIIIHWNTPQLLKKQLSLLKNGRKLQIIVIDNNSEESIGWIKKDYENIELIQNKTNRGYAYACNQGAGCSRGEWLLFLNPDVEISPTQIQQLTNHADKYGLDATSPLPGSDRYMKPIPTPFSLFVEFTPLKKVVDINKFKNKTLFGGCLLIRASILKRLKGWDEDFFLWFEDSDLSYRLLQSGYKIGWAPIHIKHKGGASFAKLDDHYKRGLYFGSMKLYASKHFSPFGRFIVSLLKLRYSF